MAVARSRPRGRPADDRLDRCAELWRQARPQLEARRYRGLTIKGLARACNLSPAGLYHYFPSKDDFVFFPLRADSEYCERQAAPIFTLHDPNDRLQAAIRISIASHVDLMLASELASEAGRLELYRPYLIDKYDIARLMVADLLRDAKPYVSPHAAAEAADRFVALIAGWYWSGRTGGSEAVIRSLNSDIDALGAPGPELIENSAV